MRIFYSKNPSIILYEEKQQGAKNGQDVINTDFTEGSEKQSPPHHPITPKEPNMDSHTHTWHTLYTGHVETVRLWDPSLANTVTLSNLVNWGESPFLQLQRCKELVNSSNDSKKKILTQCKCLTDRNFEGLYLL